MSNDENKPLSPAVAAILDAASVHIQEAQRNIECAPYEPIVLPKDTKSDKDFEFARENLQDFIKTGKNAIDELAVFAKESGHPRAYEVLANLIKSVTEANKHLLDLHRQIKELDKDKVKPQKEVHNTAVFIGTNAQLGEHLKKINGDKK